MKKYISDWRFQVIRPVEVESETEYYVVIGGRRQRKQSPWECVHDTFAQARARIVDMNERRVNNARAELVRYEAALEKAIALKESAE